MSESKQTKELPLHQLPAIHFLAAEQRTVFGEPTLSHRIDFYAMVWFMEDGGTHYIDFEPYPVKKNSVFLIGKNQVHAIPSKLLPRARTIVFSSAFFDRLEDPLLRHLFLPFQNNGIEIPEIMVQPLTQLFDLILLEYKANADLTMLVKYTDIFLSHLYRLNGPAFSTVGDDERMLRLFQLIETHFKEHRPAAFYASNIGLTPKRINEILRQKSAATIGSLINQMLLTEAKRELFHNRYTIKEIAYELGFSDQSYFARFFKKHTGKTPEEFKSRELAGFDS